VHRMQRHLQHHRRIPSTEKLHWRPRRLRRALHRLGLPPKLIRKGYVGCTTGKTFGHVIIARLHMQWVNCPAGSTLDSGHVLLEWSQDTWVYVLSLHSDTRTNRKLLRTMAAHLIRFG